MTINKKRFEYIAQKKEEVNSRNRTWTDYNSYINSPDWERTKKWYFSSEFAWKECYVCGSTTKSLDLHHKTYKNLGNERLVDLVPLCRDCHLEVHEFAKRKNLSLWIATDRYKYIKRRTYVGKSRNARIVESIQNDIRDREENSTKFGRNLNDRM